MAQLIHEHAAHIRTPDGPVFAVRTHGEQRSDGTWAGWLEFEPLERGVPKLRTERETTQASREALSGWAAGLEHAYLEGAFARAHLVSHR
jgi:hypothetical protein